MSKLKLVGHKWAIKYPSGAIVRERSDSIPLLCDTREDARNWIKSCFPKGKSVRVRVTVEEASK